MAAYSVTHKQITANYCVLQTLTNTELVVGGSIVVTGVDATINGTYSIYALPQYLLTGVDEFGDLIYDPLVPIQNQVLFAKVASDIERQSSTGTITYSPVCTWIVAADIEDYLGIGTATAADASFLTICAAAANAFAYRRRAEANYANESLNTVPSQDVKLGTIMVGAAYYKQRGSADQFASFNTMGLTPVMGLSGMVKQLLGIDRPGVA